MKMSNRCLLFRLPREIRDEIYSILLVRQKQLRRPHRFEPTENCLNIHILLLNKEIHHEANLTLLRQNSFLTSHMFTTYPVHAALWPLRITPVSDAQLSLIRDITIRVQAGWDARSFAHLSALWQHRTDIRRLAVQVHLPNLTGVHLVCTQRAAPIRDQLSALFALRNVGNVKLEIHWMGWWNAPDLEAVLRELESMAALMGGDGGERDLPSLSAQRGAAKIMSVGGRDAAPEDRSTHIPQLAFPVERMSPTSVSVDFTTEALVNTFLNGLNWKSDQVEERGFGFGDVDSRSAVL